MPSKDFRFADLKGIDFGKNDLRGFDFRGAKLDGCKFKNSKLIGAKFDLAQIDSPELEFLTSEMKSILASEVGFKREETNSEVLTELENYAEISLDSLSNAVSIIGNDDRLKIHNNAFAQLWALPEEFLKDKPRFSNIIQLCLPLYLSLIHI